MSPEQVAGDRMANPVSDVYGLGASLYYLLSGRPPFEGQNALETVRQVAEQSPVKLQSLNPETPNNLETICLKCLRKEPLSRYTRPDELRDDLRNWLTYRPITARPISVLEKAILFSRRNRKPTIATGSMVLLLMFVLTVSWHQQRLSKLKSFENIANSLSGANISDVGRLIENAHAAGPSVIPFLKVNLRSVNDSNSTNLRLALLSFGYGDQIYPLLAELKSANLNRAGEIVRAISIMSQKSLCRSELNAELQSLKQEEECIRSSAFPYSIHYQVFQQSGISRDVRSMMLKSYREYQIAINTNTKQQSRIYSLLFTLGYPNDNVMKRSEDQRL